MTFRAPIKFILPWYGKDIAGGAETLAREWVVRLARRGCDVEALATCGKALYTNWNKNDHPAGVETIDGAPVRRFRVRPGDHAAFNGVNRRLLMGAPVTRDEEETFVGESIRSDDLETHLREHGSDAALVFLPYLYGTTYWGMRIHPERSFLWPCLHNEAYARLSVVRETFERARGVIYNAEAERDLADRFFGALDKPRIVLGMGVETDIQPDPERFRERHGLRGPVLSYFGRRDETKNTPALLRFFARYAEQTNRPLALALGGRGAIQASARLQSRVRDLGFLSEQEKRDAMAASLALCQPSGNESFSIVLMEAWLCGTPALVNGFCDVTRQHCERANGGLYFRNYPEFVEALEFLIENPDVRDALGRNGRRHVLANYRWERLIDRFLQFLDENLPQ